MSDSPKSEFASPAANQVSSPSGSSSAQLSSDGTSPESSTVDSNSSPATPLSTGLKKATAISDVPSEDDGDLDLRSLDFEDLLQLCLKTRQRNHRYKQKLMEV